MAHRVRQALTIILLALLAAGGWFGAEVATHRLDVVITHGVSMNPVYYQGDMVIVARAAHYRRGDIVAYRVPAQHMVILHRIIGGNSNGFVMKGDNNQSIDPTHPTDRDVIGRAVIHIPRGGLWLGRLTNPLMLGFVAFALTAAGGATVRTSRRRRPVARHAHRTRSVSRAGTLPVPIHTAVAAIAGTALVAVMLGIVAWSAPPRSPHQSFSTTGRQVVFSYRAAVRPSAAYDASTVSSPDPVFRKLTDRVELHVTYDAGRRSPAAPAHRQLLARLSAPSGWHTSIPLAPPALLTGSRDDTTVVLDLRRFDARAAAAAAATGMPTAPLTVTIIARVSSPGQPIFEPSIAFDLTPLEFSLASDPHAMTANDASTIATTDFAPASLHLLMFDLRVTTARWIAGGVLVACLLAAAIVGVLALSSARLSEVDTIRRRYASLLASVEPTTVPLDEPVVDVVDFSTLARVAERSEQLILHWTQGDVHTFLVRDNGNTYRYVIGPEHPLESMLDELGTRAGAGFAVTTGNPFDHV